jgi:hypothetical protein
MVAHPPNPPPSTHSISASVSRKFWLNRKEDPSGISGVGIVAEGIIFTSGACAMTWLTGVSQIGVYPSLDHVRAIHGHNGMTEILWEYNAATDKDALHGGINGPYT